MRLIDAQHIRSSNLQLTKFIAAIMVIISHSFVLCTGSVSGDWIYRISDGQLTMGYVAVSIFFLCGGFLIAKSAERLSTFSSYWKTRALRIFPPLFFTVILCIVIGGLFLTQLPPKQYWTAPQTWRYLLNALLIPQHELPGVFANAPYNSTVNGSLWTLPVEFLCYIACFIFYKTGFLRKGKFCLTIPLAVITTLFSFYVSDKIPTLFTALSPCLFFYIGMTYYVYHDKIILNKKYFLMSVCLFVLFSVFHLHRLGMFLCFPYIMFTFWFGARQLPRKLAYIGNFSYGIYLLGFPVQQTIIYLFNNKISPLYNALFSIPLAVLTGALLYYIAEYRKKPN
ncbi:MAG: acyltransferase [Lachnospiraceae bacterium]|nr:acyltransferase [Lachnospiraceae bacterium]